MDGRVLSHCFITFERFDVKVITKNPVFRSLLRISGLYVTKLFQKGVPIGDIIQYLTFHFPWLNELVDYIFFQYP